MLYEKNYQSYINPVNNGKENIGYLGNFNVVTMGRIIGLLQNGNEINCN